MRIGIRGNKLAHYCKEYFEKQGHQVHHFTGYNNKFFGFQMLFKCDILVSNCVRNVMPALFLRKTTGIKVPIVLTMEGAPFKLHLKYCKRDLYTHYLIEDKLLSRFANLFDLITTTSDHWAILMEKVYNLKKNPEAVHLGVDYEKFQKNAKSNIKNVETLIKKNQNQNIILLASRFEPAKNVETFIQAIPVVLKEFDNTKFVIVGKGTLEQQIIAEIKRCKVEQNVVRLDWVSRETLAGFYSVSDVFVSTGVPGRVVYESLAAGTPVVCEKLMEKHIPILKRQILTYRWRNYKELAEKICELLRNPYLRGELGKQGKEIVRHYLDTKHSAKTFLRLFKRLVNDYNQ